MAWIGLECGGEPGRRLGRRLGFHTSGDTILRRLRRIPLPTNSNSTHTGIDDFAFRRGLKYGTIIEDLDSGRSVDLLPDRDSATTAAWLSSRDVTPTIVTRDRSAGYAAAVATGAPDAIQIAARWHLLANAREALVRVLDRHHSDVTGVARRIWDEQLPTASPIPITNDPISATDSASSQQVLSPCRQREADLSAARRARRLERYERVTELRRQGHGQRAIMRQLKIDPRTVVRFLRGGSFPERAKARRTHLVDPFVPRLKALWAEGHRNAKHLWHLIRGEGFKGSPYAVRRCVTPWRTAKERAHVSGPRPIRGVVAPMIRPSSNRLAWLLARPELPRQPEESGLTELLEQVCEPVSIAAGLTRDFGEALASRDLDCLKRWVIRATTSEKVPKEIVSFATGITHDWPEVSAAVEYPFSNGRTEGHVNRLKMIKRKMFGRAKFDLLRIRVLASGP